MAELHFRTCTICEAMCGLALEMEDGKITSIRGDRDDPLSRGYLCPKAYALKDIHEDPDRLKQPMRRVGTQWEPISWQEALDETAERLHAVRKAHGPDSIAYYQGNPHIHNYGATLMAMELVASLGTRTCFSTASMDHLPHLLASYLMFGHQLLLPIPDIDRTQYLLILGANPAVSNGSLMTAPDVPRRLKELRQRGGKVVVIDPRRTRTAELADAHHFIRPGTDALLMLAMVRTLFEEGLVKPGRLESFTDGINLLREAAQPFRPEDVALRTGIAAETIRALARDFAAAPSAVAYGRVGTSTQEFGALSCWLLLALNILTGNLDRPGGSLFTRPAVDVAAVGKLMGLGGSFGKYRSRVRGLPAFTGELPVATLAEEIDTPGDSRIRALICSAGNPVLSTPDGARLDRALAGLDFMVAIDFYLNETARHAHIILPPTFALERDHYDLSMHVLAVRNTIRYTGPLFDPGPEARHDWQIYLELATRLDKLRGPAGWAGALKRSMLKRLTPRGMLDLMLRMGPYGSKLNPFGNGPTTRKLLAQPHAQDLGSLEPRLPQRLYTPGRRIQLAPAPYLEDLRRLAERHPLGQPAPDEGLVLVGRRELRSNNSWTHNVQRLVKGRDMCTLWMHPEDARAHGLSGGQQVEIRSRVGTVVAPLQVTEAIMRGVVSLPHGFGHTKEGTRLTVASRQPGASINDLTDTQRVDSLSGTIAFSGVPVTVRSSEPTLPPESSISDR